MYDFEKNVQHMSFIEQLMFQIILYSEDLEFENVL